MLKGRSLPASMRRVYMTPRRYGNIFWTAIFQALVSALVIVGFTVCLGLSSRNPIKSVGVSDVVIIISSVGLVVILVMTARLDLSAWHLGVRDLAYHGACPSPVFVSLLWRSRGQDDLVAYQGFKLSQLIWDVGKAVGRWLKLAITRRTYVFRTVQHAGFIANRTAL
jgi:hypothetical protein